MFPKSLLTLIAVVLALTGARPAGAQGHEHGHGGHDGKATARLTLNDGKKWQTDATLRAGMTAIRDQLQAALDPIHAKTYSPDDYKALAGRIEKEVANIMAKCKLPADVDAQIHLVLAELFAGADLMKKDGNRMAGAVRILQGLDSYGKYFEHADWQPIKH
jgi:hypothetical protein